MAVLTASMSAMALAVIESGSAIVDNDAPTGLNTEGEENRATYNLQRLLDVQA